jgi:isopenicillin-N N-acyltransferase-like protein
MGEPLTMPVLRVAGSHREVGLQIGASCSEAVRHATDFGPDDVPRDGRTMAQQLELVRQYRAVVERHLPYLIEELDGVAAGADVDPLLVMAASIEEIWEPNDPEAHSDSGGGSVFGTDRGRCSDLVAGPPATADGALLIAHNNDLDADVEPHLVAIEWCVDDEPRMFTIGVGPWISVGWNAAGMALSGNELSPNDNRVGLPRLLLVREHLRKTNVTAMVDAALDPARASSYNNIFAGPNGDVVNVEGSGTDAVVTSLDARGHLVHTNHYICESMLRYEGDPAYAQHSALRLERGRELLTQARPGTVDASALLGMLADHENAPDSLCRHPTPDRQAKTVFWCVTDVTNGRITFGRGNPCAPVPQSFAF